MAQLLAPLAAVENHVQTLQQAVARGEEWAVRQVLNSPLAREIGLGNDNRPQVAVAVGAAVLDPVDTAQRLARLDAALQRLTPSAQRAAT